VSGDEIELSFYFPLMLLLMNIFIQIIINTVADLRIKSACRAINERQVQTFITKKKNSKGFELRTWESLKPGDIIKVKEDEEFPADVLILDSITSSNDHKCYVIGGPTDDFNKPSLKRACEGTYNRHGMKMSSTKFVEQISGTVKYEYNYNGYFSGNFRHNSHPAPFNITTENVVVKG
jgi:magnesium-transporting ATPase (P-type)